jgi:hypothetical protein
MIHFDKVREQVIWHDSCWLVQLEKHAWFGLTFVTIAGLVGTAPVAMHDD